MLRRLLFLPDTGKLPSRTLARRNVKRVRHTGVGTRIPESEAAGQEVHKTEGVCLAKYFLGKFCRKVDSTRQIQRAGMLRIVARKLERAYVRRGLKGTIALVLQNLFALTKRAPQAVSAVPEFDIVHGVQTAGIVDLSELEVTSHNYAYGIRYQATPVALFMEMMSYVPVRSGQVFVDFVSGKGRTLLLASEMPFKRIIGIEFVPTLHSIAERNIQLYRSTTQRCFDVKSLCIDATEFTIPEEPAVVYFYHPFEANIMAKVAERIRVSLRAHPRKMFVVYHNPAFESIYGHDSLFRKIAGTREYSIYESI
jgi:hypothetical protein